jgi:hypothetical protein
MREPFQRCYDAEDTSCFPFVIGQGESETGARIGGRPPAGIAPSRTRPECQYFATFPLIGSTSREISIFINSSIDPLFEMTDCLNDSDEISIIGHRTSERASNNLFRSDLSEHPVLISQAINDIVLDEGQRIPHSHNKLGGLPFILNFENELLDQIHLLTAKGYCQVVQVAFPGEGDALVEGDWPFGDGLFHVFGHPPFIANDWYWLWQL